MSNLRIARKGVPRKQRTKTQRSKRSPSPHTPKIDRVLRVFRKWLSLPDPGVLLIVLGAFAANYLGGCPVWLLVVGPSSGGKTTILLSLVKMAQVHLVSTLTESSLLSGTSKKDKTKDATGGLLKEIGTHGTIVLKDFTSILSISHESRASLLAALREIYDGRWDRYLGVDGGKKLSWNGHAAILGGCTGAIDTHHELMASMGERFLLYRMAPCEEKAVMLRALAQSKGESKMQEELGVVVRNLMLEMDITSRKLSKPAAERLSFLAMLTARCRSAVDRDPRSRDITLIHPSESPARLGKQLSMLYAGLQSIGVSEQESWRLISKVALDCIPTVRRLVFNALIKLPRSEAAELNQVLGAIGYPAQTTRRGLEDLTAHGVLTRTVGTDQQTLYWALSDWALGLCKIAFPTFPEKSGRTKRQGLSRKRG